MKQMELYLQLFVVLKRKRTDEMKKMGGTEEKQCKIVRPPPLLPFYGVKLSPAKCTLYTHTALSYNDMPFYMKSLHKLYTIPNNLGQILHISYKFSDVQVLGLQIQVINYYIFCFYIGISTTCIFNSGKKSFIALLSRFLLLKTFVLCVDLALKFKHLFRATCFTRLPNMLFLKWRPNIRPINTMQFDKSYLGLFTQHLRHTKSKKKLSLHHKNLVSYAVSKFHTACLIEEIALGNQVKCCLLLY